VSPVAALSPAPAAPDPAAATAAAVAASPPLPLDPIAFAEAHRLLRADGAIQFELASWTPDEVPAWLRALGEFFKWLFSNDSPGTRLALWGLAGLFLVAIAAVLVRRLRGKDWPWRRRPAEPEADAWRPEPALARHLLNEADALAAAGRYAEAAHLLLHRSIEDVDARRPDLIRKSLTSRDIAALPAIPDRPRGAFAEIALRVERSLFGRHALAEPDWRVCRNAYQRFAFAESWQ
jgi:hypothetical protein